MKQKKKKRPLNPSMIPERIYTEFLQHLTGDDSDGGAVPPGTTKAIRRLHLARKIVQAACKLATEDTYALAAEGDAEKIQTQRELFHAEALAIRDTLTDTEVRYRTIPTSLKVPKTMTDSDAQKPAESTPEVKPGHDIKDAFENYMASVYSGEDVEAEQHAEVQKGFYGGALSMFRLIDALVRMPKAERDADADIAKLKSLKAELGAFADVIAEEIVGELKKELKGADVDDDGDPIVETAKSALTDLHKAYSKFATADKTNRIKLVTKALKSIFDALDMNPQKQMVFTGAFLEMLLQEAADTVYDLQREGDAAGVIGLAGGASEVIDDIEKEFAIFKRRSTRVPLKDVVANREKRVANGEKVEGPDQAIYEAGDATSLADAITKLVDRLQKTKQEAKADA